MTFQIKKFVGSVYWGRGGNPYNGLYENAPLQRGTLLRLEVYQRVGFSRVKV